MGLKAVLWRYVTDGNDSKFSVYPDGAYFIGRAQDVA